MQTNLANCQRYMTGLGRQVIDQAGAAKDYASSFCCGAVQRGSSFFRDVFSGYSIEHIKEKGLATAQSYSYLMDIHAVSSVALTAVGIGFLSTYGVSLLSLSVAALFLGQSARHVTAFVKQNIEGGAHRVNVVSSQVLENKEKLEEVFCKYIGVDFGEYFDQSQLEALKEKTGFSDIRALAPTLKKFMEKLEQFEKAERLWDLYIRGDYYIKDHNRVEVERDFGLDMSDKSFNRFILGTYCPLKLECAYLLYVLYHPLDAEDNLLSQGEFSPAIEDSTGYGKRIDSMNFPVFMFECGDVLSSRDICHNSQTQEISTLQELSEMIDNCISEQKYEKARQAELFIPLTPSTP